MTQELLRIGEIASASGVSVDTVRFYDRKGLLQDITRSESGHRRFPRAAIERIRVIRNAMAIGFTLDELARIFRRRAAGETPCGHVLDSAKEKLHALETRIAELQSLRARLAAVIVTWESKVEETPQGGLAHLLESLDMNGERT